MLEYFGKYISMRLVNKSTNTVGCKVGSFDLTKPIPSLCRSVLDTIYHPRLSIFHDMSNQVKSLMCFKIAPDIGRSWTCLIISLSTGQFSRF